jgi:hypothetical protein
MLWVFFTALIAIWLFLVISGILLRGLIHLLLVMALVVLIVRITGRGRRI